MKALFTIGYEGKNIDEFNRILEENKVDVLFDVRQRAFSRKPFFSNGRLRKECEEKGVEYAHLPQLGAPKPLREKLYADGDYAVFFKKYSSHLKKQGDALKTAGETAREKRACLMCFEADASKCHRSVLAKKIGSANDLLVVHLR
ncbi:MAG: DUF488 domain-containing protein [Candidatus Micrarchaeota archaeon]